MRSDVGGGQLYKKRSDPGLRAPVRASSRASPAPTFDRVLPLECGRMWEVVSCTKRSDPETVVPALPSSRASPAPTFDRVSPLECGRMWDVVSCTKRSDPGLRAPVRASSRARPLQHMKGLHIWNEIGS